VLTVALSWFVDTGVAWQQAVAGITVEDLASPQTLAVVVALLVQIIKRWVKAALADKWAGLVVNLLNYVIAYVLSIVAGIDPAQSVINAALAWAFATGYYEGLSNIVTALGYKWNP